MRKKRLLIQSSALLAIIALMGTYPLDIVPIPVSAQTTEETLENQVYQQVNPAFVTIKTNNGHGSGFIVNKEGLIITNAHVLQNAPGVVTVIFNDGGQLAADVNCTFTNNRSQLNLFYFLTGNPLLFVRSSLN